jgi:hypothetical protein
LVGIGKHKGAGYFGLVASRCVKGIIIVFLQKEVLDLFPETSIALACGESGIRLRTQDV